MEIVTKRFIRSTVMRLNLQKKMISISILVEFFMSLVHGNEILLLDI